MISARSVKLDTDYISVTEIAGDEVTQEQVNRLCNRYYFAGQYCRGKDVVEAACGTGQGLGYLSGLSRSLEAGDISEPLLNMARHYYGSRIHLKRFDAQNMPFRDRSKDVIILFEAIYYLPDAEQFVLECKRVLRPKGKVLISTANKDLYDFNPSPYSHKYYGTVELDTLFSKYGFITECFGYLSVRAISSRQRILRPIKRMAVMMRLMPKTTQGKKWLKRIVFAQMTTMPAEISKAMVNYTPPTPISVNTPDQVHKVIYCVATLQ
jgi:SAM-dependent methyltransferase